MPVENMLGKPYFNWKFSIKCKLKENIIVIGTITGAPLLLFCVLVTKA